MTHTPLKFSSRSPLPNENVGFVVFGFRVFSKVIHGSTRRAHPQRGSTLLFSIHDGATACSKSAARAHCREVRSLLAFEMATRRMLARDRLSSALYIRTYVRTYIRTYVRIYTKPLHLHAFREVGGLSVGAEINLWVWVASLSVD